MLSSKTDRFSSARALYPRASAMALPLGRSGLRTWTGFYGAGDKILAVGVRRAFFRHGLAGANAALPGVRRATLYEPV